MRILGLRRISRGAGLLAIVATAALAAIHPRQLPVASIDPAILVKGAPADPLARELARCRSIGMAAKDDAACETAWTENRRRFFTHTPSPSPMPEAR